MKKIKVIVKWPSENFGHMEEIPNRLRTLQEFVGGYIEMATIDRKITVICNEEGRIRGLEPNCAVLGIPFYGTIVVAGFDGIGELTDIPISMDEWRDEYLRLRKIGE